MSEIPQGPGWWLASDGRWYPPETAPPGLFEGAYPGYQAYYWDPASPTAPPNPGAVPAADPTTPAAPTPQAPATPPDDAPDQAASLGSLPGVGPTVTEPSPPAASAGPSLAEPASSTGGDPWSAAFPATPHPAAPAAEPSWSAPPGSAPVESPRVASPRVESLRPEAAPRAPADRWRPWLALLGVALLLWGAGQGLLAWAQWRLVRQQLTSLGTVTQGHLGLALTAAGIVIAGLVTLVLSATLPRR
ncbi:hypothetical protein [Aciditerrimonas ferrireducens]|uniref:hypothetical protein n=1 Tax=Aciditerrimonas ferrireducens TaxID=667306 RepID=UPI00200615A6|nr:hypothetical protein [Aciditerrimonas ferrireducens]MCK4176454.1 hypothetical protein [Aciditerrimonas ferrireducens]